ncbi:MAG: ABC transporter ATP-binding protein [Planctomycetes bacterium]|nr:ABC transporter ATP-binding protein [Planctomycetota bacterium]
MIVAKNLHKTYRRNADMVRVLNGIDLEVQAGEFLSIIGASGSGKSTLLHLLGTLDKPDEGTITLEGRRVENLTGWERDRLRNEIFGFIFQFYHLLPELTMFENVMMPMMVNSNMWNWWGKRKEARKRATEILERVGLGHRLKHKPRELSGGEMQRTAIARALVARPRILFADEPTGNLDAATGDGIVSLLRDLNRQDGLTIIMVTHNLELVSTTDRVLRMHLGKIEPYRASPILGHLAEPVALAIPVEALDEFGEPAVTLPFSESGKLEPLRASG